MALSRTRHAAVGRAWVGAAPRPAAWRVRRVAVGSGAGAGAGTGPVTRTGARPLARAPATTTRTFLSTLASPPPAPAQTPSNREDGERAAGGVTRDSVIQRWGWLLRLFGYFGEESVLIRQSSALLYSAEQQASESYVRYLRQPDEFMPRHQIIMLHIWMLHKRLMADGAQGKALQAELFEALWENTMRRIRATGVHEMTVNKHLRDVQRMSLGAATSYDYGLAHDNDDNLELGSALWRNLFMKREQVPDQLVLDMATFVRKEVDRIGSIPRDELYNGQFSWSLPAGVKPDSILQTPWRRAIAVDGRPYFWNSVTREASWEVPREVSEAEQRAQG